MNTEKSPPTLPQKTGFWQRIFDLYFGYDYFIAHRSRDGKPYAAALYDALTAEGNELDCFLDVKHYDAGGNLPWMQSRALRKTARLIVVVTPHAHDKDAQYLQSEIRQFREYHRDGAIVSIGTAGTLRGEGFTDSPILSWVPNLDREDICVLEEEDDLLDGKVTPFNVAKLLNDFTEQRISAKRLKWIKGIALVFFILTLAAGGFGWLANERRKEAVKAQDEATKQARLATEQKGIAEQRRMETVIQSSNDSYAAAQRAINENSERDALSLLLYALRIWPESRLASDRLYGLLTQRTFALPVIGPATVTEYQGLSILSGFGVSENGVFRTVRNGQPMEFKELKEGEETTSKLVNIFESNGIDPLDNQTDCVISEDAKWLATWTNQEGRASLLVTNLDTMEQLRQDLPKEVSAIALLPSQPVLVAGCERSKDTAARKSGLTDLYLWRFATTQSKLVSQELALGADRGLTGIYPARDGKKQALLFRFADPGRDGASYAFVRELDADNLTLRADQPLAVTIPSRSKPAIDADGKVIVIPSENGQPPLNTYAVDKIDVTRINRLESPKGLEWQTGEAQFWPGTNWLLLFGADRLSIGKFELRKFQTLYHSRLKAITPPMTNYFAGKGDYFRSAYVTEELSVRGRDYEKAIHYVFDGRQGLALPEIFPEKAAVRSRKQTLPDGSAELARHTSAAISLAAKVTVNDYDPSERLGAQMMPLPMTLDLTLRSNDRPAVPLKHEFSSVDSYDAQAAISKDGRFIAIAARDEVGFPLAIWDAESGKGLTIKQQPQGLAPNDSNPRLGAIIGICFGDDPSCLCVIDEAGRVLLWDWRRRAAYSDFLIPKAGWRVNEKQHLGISELHWTGGKVEFVMDDGKDRYRVKYAVGFPQGAPKIITRLTQLVHAVTGSDADENGYVVPLEKLGESPSSATIKRLKEEWAAAPGNGDELAFCRWFLADRATRAVYPGAKQTVPESFEFFLNRGLYDEADMLTFGDEDKIERVRERKKEDK